VNARGSRRHWLAGTAAILASLGACGVHAQTRIESRAVAGVRRVQWLATGELFVEQTGRERLSIEAEPTLLPRILTELQDGQLTIRFAPGHIETRHPIRIHLEVAALEAFEAQGTGTLSVGPLTVPALSLQLAGSETLQIARLSAQRLEVRLDGSGSLDILGGQVDRQQVVIAGAADYTAPQLSCRAAVVSIEGAGTVRLVAAERLQATIDGSGDVLYVGQPKVTLAISGSGMVRRVGPRPG
jgi:sarcosine oxidase gamma subunit